MDLSHLLKDGILNMQMDEIERMWIEPWTGSRETSKSEFERKRNYQRQKRVTSELG